MNSDADIQKAIESVVLYRIDCEKGEGIEIAKEFKIHAYPTFALLNKDGQILDRWLGYAKDYFLKTLPDATADLATIEEKKTRFQTKPDLRSSVVLGRYASAMGEYKEAVAYYSQAKSLNTDPTVGYSYEIFDNTYSGVGKQLFTYDDAVVAADNAIKGSKTPMTICQISSMMVPSAQKREKKADVVKYLQAGLDATANSEDKDITQAHKSLMVDFCLLVKADTATAVEYKKATMADGWLENANDLNEFAWWCFDNSANLKEAEQLSRKSVTLAKAGKEKASNLDTLAEIVHAKGNTAEAVELSKQACKEDPSNKYFPSQVEKFQKAMAEKK